VGLFDKYGTRSTERARAKKELQIKLSLFAGAVLFLLVLWLLSRLGPHAVEDLNTSEWTLETGETLEILDSEVTGYVQRFRSLQELNQLSEADLVLIELAIDKQKQLMRSGGSNRSELSDSKRLSELKAFMEEVKGATLAKKVEASLKIAREAIREGNGELGELELERAIIFQNRINHEYSASVHRNLAYARTLEIELNEFRAGPINTEAGRLTEEGLKKLGEQAFGEALRRFEEALALRTRLVRDFGSTRFVSRSDLLKLEQLIVDARVGDVGLKFEGLRAEASALLKSGKYTEAEQAITEGQRLYLSLKERYKGSSLVGAKTEEALELERQTVLSAPLVDTVKKLRLELTGSLQKRETIRSAELAAEYYRNVRRLGDSFKLSQLIDDRWILEARFLNHVRYDLRVIQDNIYDALLPLPGYADKKMLGLEVSQGLYRLVLGENPSSQVAERNPVESLTFDSAQKFATRISWILGYETMLPSRDEFLAALGEVKRMELDRLAWHSQNSGRETHEINTGIENGLGYHNLLGNVAEWLRDSNENSSGDQEVLVIGGSVRDSALSLSRIPEEWVSPSDRNRFTGFRIVVDFKVN